MIDLVLDVFGTLVPMGQGAEKKFLPGPAVLLLGRLEVGGIAPDGGKQRKGQRPWVKHWARYLQGQGSCQGQGQGLGHCPRAAGGSREARGFTTDEGKLQGKAESAAKALDKVPAGQGSSCRRLPGARAQSQGSRRQQGSQGLHY